MENNWELFEKFLITENVNISLNNFLINAALIILITWLLSLTYQKVGKSLSNKKDFGANFMLLAFTTMLIITIVKSSLALSLGLVGALSIVRFRSAIKEPEELTYLFFAIAMGLGLGADQAVIVICAFLVLMLILWGRYFISFKQYNSGKGSSQTYFVTISANKEDKVSLASIQNFLLKNFKKCVLKRADESDNLQEFAFVISTDNLEQVDNFKTEIKSEYPSISVSILDLKAY